MTHEPRVAFVAWQCPEPENRGFYPIARLLQRAGSPRYEVAYVRGIHEAMDLGFHPFLGPDLSVVHRSEQLPAFLANRLMSPQRPDYAAHVQSLGLPANAEPICVLARSEGAKVTDNLEVFGHPTFDASSGMWIYHGFCRGIRHLGSESVVSSLRPGDRLIVAAEPTNAYDADALLLLRLDSQILGYVPRTLIEDLKAAQDVGHPVLATVERVNAHPAPVQQRLLVRMEVPAMHGFRPLSTDRYQPVAAEATVVTAESMMQSCS